MKLTQKTLLPLCEQVLNMIERENTERNKEVDQLVSKVRDLLGFSASPDAPAKPEPTGNAPADSGTPA
jgi:hypothetical protein